MHMKTIITKSLIFKSDLKKCQSHGKSTSGNSVRHGFGVVGRNLLSSCSFVKSCVFQDVNQSALSQQRSLLTSSAPGRSRSVTNILPFSSQKSSMESECRSCNLLTLLWLFTTRTKKMLSIQNSFQNSFHGERANKRAHVRAQPHPRRRVVRPPPPTRTSCERSAGAGRGGALSAPSPACPPRTWRGRPSARPAQRPPAPGAWG